MALIFQLRQLFYGLSIEQQKFLARLVIEWFVPRAIKQRPIERIRAELESLFRSRAAKLAGQLVEIQELFLSLSVEQQRFLVQLASEWRIPTAISQRPIDRILAELEEFFGPQAAKLSDQQRAQLPAVIEAILELHA